MQEIKIYFSEDTEEIEMICIMEKGFRWDVVVQIGDDFYEPQYYTLEHLLWSFNVYKELKRPYIIEPCLILVDTLVKQEIINTTIDLYKYSDFFTKYRPIKKVDTTKLVQVYPALQS